MEDEHQTEIQKLKDENMRLRARCSLLETDKELNQYDIKSYQKEVVDLNRIIQHLESVATLD
jgi:hypothetical protein